MTKAEKTQLKHKGFQYNNLLFLDKDTKGKVEISLVLYSSIGNHIVSTKLKLGKHDKFLHVPHFAMQLLHGNKAIESSDNESNGTESIEIDFKKNFCRDVIIYNDVIYLLDVPRNEKDVDKDHIQFTVTQKILKNDNFKKKNYIPHIENVNKYVCIICANPPNIFMDEKSESGPNIIQNNFGTKTKNTHTTYKTLLTLPDDFPHTTNTP